MLRDIANATRRLWVLDRPLTAVGLLMAGVLPIVLAGLVLDPRVVTGAPAWLKPAKFAASASLYSLTLAWMLGYLTAWPRLRFTASWTTATVFVVEVAIICVQAWRGVPSHFNVGSPLDAALFSLMGTAIVIQTVASAAVGYALMRQHIPDAAMRVALRAGMTIAILGASIGGLMTAPTARQVQSMTEGRNTTTVGAHTVGGDDGEPGIPLVGWSRDHGDLRIPHFVGLHAIQVLPLIAWLVRRRGDSGPRVTRVAAASYAALVGLLLVQALRGEPLFSRTPLSLVGGGVWVGLTVLGIAAAGRTPPAATIPAAQAVEA
ncbi:MAG: hypothetical protein JSU08_10180 [Acidobacteria bacterium]|nr:hypothetical protein [Acidobacteriota bacterium]